MKNSLFPIFYFLLSLFIYLISIPFLISLIFKKKYRLSIPARFFLYKNPPFKEPLLHFHTCSLGETKSIAPIVKNLNEEINLSVITNTGYEEGKKLTKNIRFLPFEIFLPFWIKKCKKLIVLEAELWYMLFFIAKKRCNQTILLNARISDKSYPKYLKFRWFYKQIFQNIDLILAQSPEDKTKLQTLGAKNIKVTGNIKTLFTPTITTNYIKKKKLLVIASTHKKEEELILKNIPFDKYQVVVVPRHPERFEEVYSVMKSFMKVERLSSKFQVSSSKLEIKDIALEGDLILCDMMGELINLYKVADVVILGGSFVDNVGGHNPIEVAYFQKPLISGEYIFNQKALFKEIENAYITNEKKLYSLLQQDLQPSKIKNQASLEKIIQLIKE